MDQGEKRKANYSNSESNKRAKPSDEPKPSGFEKELANFDPIVSSKLKLRRPPLSPLNPSTDAVVFQQLDLDHYIGRRVVLFIYNFIVLSMHVCV